MDNNQNQQKPTTLDSSDYKGNKVSSQQIDSNLSFGETVNPEIAQIYETENTQSIDYEGGQPQDTNQIYVDAQKNMISSTKKPTGMPNEEIKSNERSKPLLPLSAKEEVQLKNKKNQISRNQDPIDVYEKTVFELNKKPGNESFLEALREWFMKEYKVKPGPDPIPSRPQSVRPKTNAELMNQAFLELEKAKIQLSKITYSDFMKISTRQVIFNENGKHVAHLKNAHGTTVQEFFQTESGERSKPENFFNILSHQVFRNLKYLGNFNDTVGSDFFLSRDAKNEYFRKISSKVLFYFIFYACEQIQDQLMARYQEEPFNPVSLVTYQQWQKDKGVLNVKNESIRTINLSYVFKKMKIMQPTLICIGKRLINKSTLLNDLFRVQFETLEIESIGLFHDSVDIIFSSQEFPTGFNVIDFNGQSNEDYQMIELLLKTLPKTVLFVQSNSIDYIQNVLERIDEEVREKFSQQIIYIDKSAEPDEEAYYKIQDTFLNLQLDLDKENVTFAQSQVFFMGNVSSGDQYKSRIQSLREKLSEFFKSQYLLKIFKMQMNDPITDQGVWGGYWSLEDSFRSKIQTFTKMKLYEKNAAFKKQHMEFKKYLSEHKTIRDQQKLSRKLVFPRYNREIIRKQLKKQLDDSDQRLTQKQKIELENQILSLDQQNVQEHEIFVRFIKYYMMEDQELVSDMLALIESYYMPLIKVKKAELKQATQDANKNRDELQKFYTEDQRKKTNLTQLEEQKFQNLSSKKSDFEKRIKSLMDEIEDKVLDSDLFLREAKLKFKPSGNKNNQKEEQVEREKFLKILLKEFQNGKPLEIIDGDLDKCEKHSLEQIMQWLSQIQSGSNKSIFVVTILGPQSSGKSTLLNYLFGAKFAVSAGRCTKGLNAMLLTTDYPDLPNIIILDSEGIFSIERDDPKFDRRLAIFCMSISNLLMINIKGEVNQSVAKVLQVAVYAMKKITECDQATNIPDIKFILRDQVDGNPEFVENTYQQLKTKFKEAADAAGCSLENIINLDYDFSNMVQLFSMAFSQVTYDKENITQSTEVFRKKCAEFRYQLLHQQSLKAGGAQNQSFSRLSNSVDQVWQAVINNENLMVLQDLKSIIDYRSMIIMMEEYRSIMSKPYNKREEKKMYPNPLYVSTQDQRANNPFNIEGDQTFYAKCQLIIEDGIVACNRADINEKQLQILVEKFNKELENLKDEEIKISRERVQIATQQMDQEIISQAKRYLDNSIDELFSKAKASWKEKQASGNIDSRIRQTENKLKNILLDSIKLDKKLTLKDFKAIVNIEIGKTRQEVKRNFLANEEEIIDQAKTAFKIQYQQSSKEQDNSNQSEESKQVSQKNTRYQILREKIEPSKKMIFLLTKLQDLKIEQIEEFYAKLDKQSLENKAKYQAKFEIEQQLYREKEGRWQITNKLISLFGKGDKEIQQIETQKAKDFITEWTKQAQLVISEDCKDLILKINKVIQLVENENKSLIEQRGYPQDQMQKLFDILEQDLQKQKNHQYDSKNHLKFAQYQTNMLTTDFNQLIFKELYKQAIHSNICSEVKIDNKLQNAIEQLDIYYEKQTKTLEGVQAISESFIVKINEFLIKLIFAHYEQKFSQYFEGYTITKKDLSTRTLEQFENAGKEQKQDIIDFMKDPVSLEKRVFQKRYTDSANNKKRELIEEFQKEMLSMSKKIVKFLKLLDIKKPEMENKRQQMVDYLIIAILSSLVEPTNEMKRELTDKKDAVYDLFNDGSNNFKMHQCDKLLTNFVDNKNLTQDQLLFKNEIQFLVDKIPSTDTSSFFQFLPKQQENYQSQKLVQASNIMTRDIDVLLTKLINKKLFYDVNLKTALGCTQCCPFCGARCNQSFECKAKDLHKSDHHRPMAFKGTYELKNGKKILLRDYCSSQQNMKSRWPKKVNELNNVQTTHRRLGDEQLKVDKLNVYLSWATGSDLDINVRCTCNQWHGYGTDDNKCICTSCKMARDKDVMCGADDRSENTTVEHVYFDDETKMIGKTIGIRVFNFTQNSKLSKNQFKMCIFNKYGYQLFPVYGKEAIESQDWMFCTNVAKTFSAERNYTFNQGDLEAGKDSYTNIFAFHAKACFPTWEFSECDANQKADDVNFRNFIFTCGQKWAIVKAEMCVGFELLDTCAPPL